MKYLASFLLVAAILLSPLGATTLNGVSASAPAYSGYPTISIVSVERDVSVTITMYNLPPNDEFRVRMGYIGTRGVNGIKVTSFGTESGGTQTATFAIPSDLFGLKQIAIRIESKTGSGYFAYNWFYNNTTDGDGVTPSPRPGYTRYPTFSIKSVDRNKLVTIVTKNLPPDDTFVVRMNTIGTRGINGYKGDTFDTGDGGTQEMAFAIPEELKGLYQIAIRIESVSGSGYYAYNWFYNTDANLGTGAAAPTTQSSASASTSATTTTVSAAKKYSGYPTFKILAVQRNKTVTIRIRNLPANDEFKVLMGYYGTRGISGVKVTSLDTIDGGNQTHTFTIPESLKGQYRIAIRLQSKTGSGYYAYNWFYNNTTN